MEKLQLRLTPGQAELLASRLTAGELATWTEDERRELAEQAARLNHLAARARARAARAETR